jgi:nucleoid DNA-binding protein
MTRATKTTTKAATTCDLAKPLTKKQFAQALAALAAGDGITVNARVMGAVLDFLPGLVAAELRRSGQVTIPGVAKFKAVRRPATEAGTRPNPFRPGETLAVKAKPATTKVKAGPVKALKDALAGG